MWLSVEFEDIANLQFHGHYTYIPRCRPVGIKIDCSVEGFTCETVALVLKTSCDVSAHSVAVHVDARQFYGN